MLLIKGADWLVDGAAAIARKLDVSDLVIGLTIVSFGTSAPELAVNVIASFKGSSELAIGNIVGSNIANILLILGIAALIRPLTVQNNTVWKEIPLSLLAAIMVGVLANDVLLGDSDKDVLTRSDGLALISYFSIFLAYAFNLAKQGQGPLAEDEVPEDMPLPKALLLTVVGLVALPLGGHWIVGGAVHLAQSVGISETFIGLSIVAIGTSLPEVAASAAAAYKGKTDIAIGNAIGSNIFNIFWVLGLSSTIKALPYRADSNTDLGMIAIATIMLMLFVANRERMLKRSHAVVFLLVYVGYLIFLGIRG